MGSHGNTRGQNVRSFRDFDSGSSLKIGLLSLVAIVLTLSQPSGCAEIFERVGTVGAVFLQIQPDPRGEALGGAYSALTKGVAGVYWNPGGLAFAPGMEFADQGFVVDEIEWPGDASLSFQAAAISLGALMEDPRLGTISLWRSKLGMGPIPETTEYRQDGTGYRFDAEEKATGYSYAHRITETLALGVTYKYIETRLADYNSDGHGFDLGWAYHRVFTQSAETELEIGAAAGLRNLGSLDYGTGYSTDLPRQGYIGVAPTVRVLPMWDWLVELTLAGELAYDDPLERWVTMAGVEVALLGGMAVRLGKHNAEGSARQDSWGLGGAVRYGDIAGLAFDYAKTDMDLLGDVERFMLTLRFLGCSDGLDIRALIENPRGPS
jgi:hypothetical protein